MAYSENPYPGKETLRTILQLVRYDIPCLIVGKSSIGKSYTIIELTKKWRITNSLLYIGSEKVENIEGLAKIISSDYDKDEAGSDILKFLKPYWFPNTKTITEQVGKGRLIFENYFNNYYSAGEKQYTYEALHSILLGCMDIDFGENETEISVQLIDRGDNNISDVTSPKTLNEKAFTFKRTLESVVQVETANEGTLPPAEAGFDELKMMCMYLCTVLGYGNYWLILDELDKVTQYEQDKYAPLLHIVRERTLKNWTMKEVNDKEGLNIPNSIDGENYESVVKLVNNSLDRGLPVLDTRIIGIANATKDIEEALFRRFCQVVMESVMSLSETNTPEVNAIKNCIKENVGENQMNLDSLIPKITFLDEVNLQWQYGFLPKMLNQTDRFGNYFYKDFITYYQKTLAGLGSEAEAWNAIATDPYRFERTAFGKIWKDNFIADKDISDNPTMEKEFGGLFTLWACLVENEFNPGGYNSDVGIAGFDEGVSNVPMTELEQERQIMAEEIEELGPENFLYQTTRDLTTEYEEAKISAPSLTEWTNKVLQKIGAANVNSKGDYDTLPGTEPLIPALYKVLISSYRNDKQLDADLFNQQMMIVNDFFTEFLNRDGLQGTHPVKVDKSETERLFYGVELSKIRGLDERKKASQSKQGLYGITGHYDKSMSFALYMRFNFLNEFLLFQITTLNDLQTFNAFKDKTKIEGSEENMVYNFLHTPVVKDRIKEIYDNVPPAERRKKNVEFLRQLMDFEK